MQYKLNVLMLSYGSVCFKDRNTPIFRRHMSYASSFSKLTYIQLTKSNISDISIKNFKTKNIKVSYYLFGIFKLVKSIDVGDYDIITTKDPFLTGFIGYVLKLLNKKVKLHVQNHSNFFDNPYWLKEKPYNFLLKKIGVLVIKNADRLRVVNKHEKEIYNKKYNVKYDKIDIAPIPIDPIFYDTNFKDKLDLIDENQSIKIGWAGRFVKLKRLELLFEIFSNLRLKEENAGLYLAGNYNNSEYNLKKLEKEFNINPNYLGHLNKEDLKKFYNTIDCLVLTSKYEGYGMVIEEALACGCKVFISNDILGSKDLINDGENGIIFKSKEHFLKLFPLINTLKPKPIKPKSNQNVIESLRKTYSK